MEKDRAERMINYVYRAEEAMLVCMLLGMIGLAVTQIVLRGAFKSGIVWADPLIRMLVLWISLAGGMIASRQGRHIQIDIISRHLGKRGRKIAEGIVQMTTAGICSVIAWYGIKFVQMESASGDMAFANVPSWICSVIIPFAFGMIAFRYALLSFFSFRTLFGPSS